MFLIISLLIIKKISLNIKIEIFLMEKKLFISLFLTFFQNTFKCF